MGCCKTKNINYVNDLIKQVTDYEKYIKIINPTDKNYTNISSIKIKNNRKLVGKLFLFFYKLLNYNMLEGHKDNKYKFLYFITEDDIYYNNEQEEFVLSINADNCDDWRIREEIQKREKYIYIQPILNLQLRKNNEKLLELSIKNNKFLSWSVAIFLLINLYDVPFEKIQVLYNDCLFKEKVINFDVMNLISKDKASLKEMELIDYLLEYNTINEGEIFSILKKLYNY